MTELQKPLLIHGGHIPKADRIQRLIIGGALMLLTLAGFAQQIEWRGIVAFSLQAELLLTGTLGWCPVYWSCSKLNARR